MVSFFDYYLSYSRAMTNNSGVHNAWWWRQSEGTELTFQGSNLEWVSSSAAKRHCMNIQAGISGWTGGGTELRTDRRRNGVEDGRAGGGTEARQPHIRRRTLQLVV
jgi:hypothetical protein